MAWPGGGSGSDRNNGGMAEDPNDILVFGYACKLFRDDDKAKWIDDENHMIPWNGDSTCTIDRYDGRGALMDLRGNGGNEGVEPLEALPMSESKLEQLLDEERYRDLREDSEFDDSDYQEVEFRKFQFDVKDSQSSYAAVGYSYEDSKPSEEESNNGSATVSKPEDERPFVKPRTLDIPSGIVLPPTMKLHSIIEKTAKFIASHGSQMEIILKTKQSGNPLFNFLDYKDSLNPYFKFLVQAIRDNVYTPTESMEKDSDSQKSETEEGSNSEDEGGYLHPSLFRSSNSEAMSKSTSFLPPNFKADIGTTAYSLLVSKIRGTTNIDQAQPTTSDSRADSSIGENGLLYSTASSYYGHTGNPPFPPNTPYPQGLANQNQLPPPNDQLVIEKMASYVVKNGQAFEDLARTKGDPRFFFLFPTHEYHWYYRNCKERFLAECSSVVASNQFISYSSEATGNTAPLPNNENTPQQSKIILKAVELPLSALGIPIANLESISSRPASIPPEVASRIELIKKKNSLFGRKEPSPVKIQFATSIGKGLNIVGDSENVPLSCFPAEESDDYNNISMAQKPKEDDLTKTTTTTSAATVLSEAETERLRKQMRREKAALFLQKIKFKSTNSPRENLTENNNEENEMMPEEEKVPSPLVINVSSPSVTDETCDKKANESPRYRESRKRSKSRRRKERRRSSSSRSSSSSSYDSESTSDSDRRRRHRKRKSSKKRKKRRSRERSRSRSNSRSKSHKKSKKKHRR